MRGRRTHFVLLLAGFVGARAARADPIDTFGFDARGKGMANATTAAGEGVGAILQNPAAGALAAAPEIAVGYSYGAMLLHIDGRDAQVTDPRGLSLGVGLPVRCGAVCTFALDFGLYLPDQYVVRIQSIPSSEPHFVLLDNDLDRIVLGPSLALRVGPLSVGAGITLLADAAGNGIDFTVGARGGTQVGQALLDLALPTRAAPLLGLVYAPWRWLRLGAAYRGEIDLHLRLDVHAKVDIPGGGDTEIAVRALNFYTPRKLSLGVALAPTDSLTLALDASYYNWSAFSGGVTDLRILVDLEIAPALLAGTFPADRLHDTLGLHAGGEWRRPLGEASALALRGGLGYEPSPVPDQVLFTSYADNDRLLLTAGIGALFRRIPGFLEKPVRFDAAIEWHTLLPRQTAKLDPALPAFSSGGGILHLALDATASF